MKLAVAGKGGVGKTTVCALLAKGYTAAGHRVFAVDADPNVTLAAYLGFPAPEQIRPLLEMEALITERTGVKPGTQGAFFKLNPTVDDIPARFSVTHEGVCLLRMGSVKQGGAGCYCAEGAFLKSLVAHLVLSEQDVLILDMEAGVEHLTRGTARGVDWLIAVAEPSRQSVATVRRIESLARDIGLHRLGVVGNKVRDEQMKQYLADAVAPLPLLGTVPYDEELSRAEFEGRAPDLSRPELNRQITGIMETLSEGNPQT